MHVSATSQQQCQQRSTRSWKQGHAAKRGRSCAPCGGSFTDTSPPPAPWLCLTVPAVHCGGADHHCPHPHGNAALHLFFKRMLSNFGTVACHKLSREKKEKLSNFGSVPCHKKEKDKLTPPPSPHTHTHPPTPQKEEEQRKRVGFFLMVLDWQGVWEKKECLIFCLQKHPFGSIFFPSLVAALVKEFYLKIFSCLSSLKGFVFLTLLGFFVINF